MYSTPEINTNQRHNPTTKMKQNNQYNHLPKIKLLNQSNLSTTLSFCETHYICSICPSPILLLINLSQPYPPVCLIVCLYLCQLLISFVSTFLTVFVSTWLHLSQFCLLIFLLWKVSYFLTRAIYQCGHHGCHDRCRVMTTYVWLWQSSCSQLFPQIFIS